MASARRRATTTASGTPGPTPSSDRAPRGRRRAGRLASGGTIRDAAAALFLERGYQGTSMDDIAAAAQVSKQTIYTHFPDKPTLFADLVLGNADRVQHFLDEMRHVVHAAADAEQGLRELARLYARFVIRPQVVQMRRLVLAEAGRFPDLARTYYERVPERVYSALADLLQGLAAQGDLRIEDPYLAAHHFAWLVLGLPLDRAMFDADTGSGDVALTDAADAGVGVFLAAYANR